jgi:hypothetical protein
MAIAGFRIAARLLEQRGRRRVWRGVKLDAVRPLTRPPVLCA